MNRRFRWLSFVGLCACWCWLGIVVFHATALADESSARPAKVAAGTDGRQAVVSMSGRPWVLVEFGIPKWSNELRRSVVADLSAGLRRSGIDVSVGAAAGGRDPLARILFSRPGDRAADPGHRPGTARVGPKPRPGDVGAGENMVEIAVIDDVTGKRVVRPLELGSLRGAALSLGIALAAEDLLRASWAELVLKTRAQGGRSNPPKQVVGLVRKSLRSEYVGGRKNEYDLVARPLFDYYSGGVMQYGGDIDYIMWLHPRAGVLVALGGRGMIPASSDGGEITGYGLVMTVGGIAAIVPPKGVFRLNAALRLSGMWLRFHGHPIPSYSGESITLGGLRLIAEIRPAFRVTRGFFLGAQVGVGGTLLGVNLLEQGRTVQRLFGAVVSGGLTASVRW